MTKETRTVYVDHLPDLITREDYEAAHREKKVRFQLVLTDAGVEIIGDSAYPQVLEELLAALDPAAVEAVLCG